MSKKKNFLVGEYIVCPLYGAGKIRSKKNVPTSDGNRKFFEVIFEHSKTKLSIPCDSAEKGEMRYPSKKKDVKKVFELLETLCAVKKNEQWKKTHIKYLEKLQEGDMLSVAEVVRALMTKKLVKNLSATENKTLNDARNILISEISIIEKKAVQEISDRMDNLFYSKKA